MMGLAEEAQLAVRIDLKGNATSGIGKLNSQVSGLQKSVGKVGKGFGQIGAGVARAGLLVGGAAVAGFGAAAKAAIDFEDAFAGVRKTVNEADLTKVGLSFDTLARSFRNMATEIPIAATDFAKLGETAGALGVNAKDIETFVKTTALLGVTTDLTADAAADALGRIGTILNFTGKDYVTFADSLVALGNAGASTESEIIEISKRFAGAGRQAGLATTEIAGLASITAALGFGPERGGTALARVFANMGTNIALANKKGTAFSKVVGKPVKTLIEDLRKGKALNVFRDFLVGLSKLDRIEASKALKAAGITNAADRQIFVDMAANIDKVDASLLTAKNSVGALGIEAQKRFDTVASKIKLLQQNLIEAGITLGEGFAPAIGRAAVKLADFLKQDANKSQLKALGEDIGEAIDGIDWQKVLDGARDFTVVMKTALGFTMRIVDALNKLPTELKGAVAGFLVLNKLSGGLVGAGVGNVVGGLAGAASQGILSRTPGVGKLFAQPVFVTNWPIGGIGGGAAGAGGSTGLLGLLGPAGIVAAASMAVTELTKREFADKGIDSNFRAPDPGILGGLTTAFHNITEILRIAQTPPRKPNERAPSDPKPVDFMPKLQDSFDRAVVPVTSAVAALKPTVAAVGTAVGAAATKTALATQIAGIGAALGTAAAGVLAANASTGAGNQVAGAINAKDMSYTTNVKVDVNVTAANVSKTIVIQKRYGPANGSRGQDGSGVLHNGAN